MSCSFFQNLRISSKHQPRFQVSTLLFQIWRILGNFPGIVKNASKGRSQKERWVVGQKEFDKMEQSSMAKDDKILALKINLWIMMENIQKLFFNQ